VTLWKRDKFLDATRDRTTIFLLSFSQPIHYTSQWRRRELVPPKDQCSWANIQGVKTQKTTIWPMLIF